MKTDVESLHFNHNSLMHFFQSELYINVKISYSRQWFENVQMHLCTLTVAQRDLMLLQPQFRISHFHFCQYILCFKLLLFSVHYGIKKLHMVHKCVYALLPLNDRRFDGVSAGEILKLLWDVSRQPCLSLLYGLLTTALLFVWCLFWLAILTYDPVYVAVECPSWQSIWFNF